MCIRDSYSGRLKKANDEEEKYRVHSQMVHLQMGVYVECFSAEVLTGEGGLFNLLFKCSVVSK